MRLFASRRQWLTHGPMVGTVYVLVRWGREVFAASFVLSWGLWFAGIEPWGRMAGVIAVAASGVRFGIMVGSALGPDGIRTLENRRG